MSKAAVAFDHWNKDVAPSTELRKWYGHDLEKFAEFSTRYRAELRSESGKAVLQSLRDCVHGKR